MYLCGLKCHQLIEFFYIVENKNSLALKRQRRRQYAMQYERKIGTSVVRRNGRTSVTWTGEDPEFDNQSTLEKELPHHVAVIMDGNRRWARARGLPSFMGHQQGVSALRDLVKTCIKWKIPYLTAFAFSTENWLRSKKEVTFLLQLIEATVEEELPDLIAAGVRLKFVGDQSFFESDLNQKLRRAEKSTENGDKLVLSIALGYSGRQEITQAVKDLCFDVIEGKIPVEDIKENDITSRLSLSHIPLEHIDADLIIRTSGEQRISNFLLWEAAYSELYFSSTLWPDFSEKDFATAVNEYANRNRRYGWRS